MRRHYLLVIVLLTLCIGPSALCQQKLNTDSLRHVRLLDSIRKAHDTTHRVKDTSHKKLDTSRKRMDPALKRKLDSMWTRRLDSLRRLRDTTNKTVVAPKQDSVKHDSAIVKLPAVDSTKIRDSINRLAFIKDSIASNQPKDTAKKDTTATAVTPVIDKGPPPPPPYTPLVAIGFSILLIGFFAGIEIAFVSASKLSVELKKKQGSYAGRIWSAYMDKPTRFIGTMLTVLNLLLVVYGLLWSNAFESLWYFLNIHNPYIKLTVETLISTFFLLFFEFIFKAWFRAKNDTIISSGLIAFIVQFFYSVFASIATVFVNMAEWILKYMFNVKLHDRKEVFSKIDLEHFIQQNKTHDIEDNVEMNNELFENVLSLSEIKVRTCLVPRKEIEGVEASTSLEGVRKKFVDTKLSKLIVYEGNIDNVLGYIHQLDMFKNPQAIKSILLPIPAIPESMSATDLISKFSKERKSIAWVVDEFGGTAGIITMEDILEEIFGEIRDEYDTIEEFVDKQLSANEYIFSGRLELDFITEKYKLPFRHDEETETLSGYIISQHETIPKQKDRIIIDDYEFDVLNVSETRIETVKLKVLK
jgi:putative hemolysin